MAFFLLTWAILLIELSLWIEQENLWKVQVCAHALLHTKKPALPTLEEATTSTDRFFQFDINLDDEAPFFELLGSSPVGAEGVYYFFLLPLPRLCCAWYLGILFGCVSAFSMSIACTLSDERQSREVLTSLLGQQSQRSSTVSGRSERETLRYQFVNDEGGMQGVSPVVIVLPPPLSPVVALCCLLDGDLEGKNVIQRP